MTKHYMKEFSDFDNGDAIDKMLEQLKPHGFDDESWHNDTCPCIIKEISEDNRIQIFVDYKDPQKSEYPEDRESGSMKIFGVYSGECEISFETDSFDDAVAKAITLSKAA